MLTDKFLSEIKTEILCDSNIESIDGNSMIPIELGGTLKYGTKQTVSVSDLGRQLLLAARNGETVQVHELMSRGAPFTTDWLGTSPLHLAAMNNHLETCEVLIRAGIGKDARTKVDRTPLHFAVFEGHIQITELFLINKCEVDARDMLKMTALHWAIEKKHKRIIELLLQYGADPTVVTKFDKTPASIAIETGQTDVVEMLEMAVRLKMENSSQVQAATDSILYELQKDITKDSNHHHLNMDTDNDEKDNLNMDSSSSDMHLNSENDTATNDSSNIMEYDSNTTLSEAIIQLQNIDETKPLDTNTLQMLKSHGISFLPQDDTDSIISSALQNGRKLVLTENGKLLLNGITKTGSNNSISNNKTKLHGDSVTTNGQYITQSSPTTTMPINELNLSNQILSNYQQQPTNITNTLKLIKKSAFNHNQSSLQQSSAKNINLKTNRVIKILSAEEFKQICRGDVKKLGATIQNNSNLSNSNNNGSNLFSNILGSNNDIQITTTSSSSSSSIGNTIKFNNSNSGNSNNNSNSIKVQTIKSPNILTGSSVVVSSNNSVNNNINFNNNNNNNKQTQRRIVVNKNKFNAITAGIKMPIYANEIKGQNNKGTINSSSNNNHSNLHNETIYSLATTSSGITVPIIHHQHHQQQNKLINNLGKSSTFNNNNNNLQEITSNNNNERFVSSNIGITEVERQLNELKKQTDELRKQLELSQKQTEEYKVRLEKLEKEREIEKEERKRIKL